MTNDKPFAANNAGITKLGLVIAVGASFALLLTADFSVRNEHSANAGVATTSVRVLNTPPEWSVDAQEGAESSVTAPTNTGTAISWTATAVDPNSESAYLLICKTSGAPTPNASAAPACAGGVPNRWAVSGLTNSGAQATATYTTQVSDLEQNDWYAWICDANAFSPKCNVTYKQGTGSTAAPFVVNHRPTFTVFSDDSARDPGQAVTWTTTAADADTYGGADNIKLFVCMANDFNGTSCGAGGTYCESAFGASNPSCNFTLEALKQDRNYPSYGFVIDDHNFGAIGGSQGADSVLTVANVAPTISNSSIQLLNTTEVGGLLLTTEQGQTSGFKVKFTAADNNSCQNASSGNELTAAAINVYRSGIGSAACRLGPDYNPNNCYPAAVGVGAWNTSCSQDVGSCNGASDSDATWTCTFPLWSIAEPTDGANTTDSPWFAEDWRASVRATDDNAASNLFTEGSIGNEVVSLLAYTLNTMNINFGSLEPGQSSTNLDQTTVVASTGNVGLDEVLYGDDMCTTYPLCAASATSTIAVNNQHFGLSSMLYALGSALGLNPGTTLDANVNKTTSTSTPATKSTFWGIAIPGSITLAGDYTGQNTIIGIKGEGQNW